MSYHVKKNAAVFCINSRAGERSPEAKKLYKVSSEFQGPSSEDVHRPRVGASAKKSLGMQLQENAVPHQEQPKVVIRKNEIFVLNIFTISSTLNCSQPV